VAPLQRAVHSSMHRKLRSELPVPASALDLRNVLYRAVPRKKQREERDQSINYSCGVLRAFVKMI